METMYDIPDYSSVETHFEYPYHKGVYVDGVYTECEFYTKLGLTLRRPTLLTPRTPATIDIYANQGNGIIITEFFENLVFWSMQQVVDLLELYGYKIVR